MVVLFGGDVGDSGVSGGGGCGGFVVVVVVCRVVFHLFDYGTI